MYKEQNYVSLLLILSMFISFNFVLTRSGSESGQNFYVCITTKYLIIKRGCWDPFTSSTLPHCWPVPSVQWGKYILFLHSKCQFKMMIRISIIYTFEQYSDLPVANKMIVLLNFISSQALPFSLSLCEHKKEKWKLKWGDIIFFNTTGATNGAGTVYRFGAPEFPPGF